MKPRITRKRITAAHPDKIALFQPLVPVFSLQQFHLVILGTVQLVQSIYRQARVLKQSWRGTAGERHYARSPADFPEH